MTITSRAPKAWMRRAVQNPTRKLATAEGRSRWPDSLIEAPKPYPAEDGVCRNWGRNPNDANMPNPTNAATRLVVQTPRSRIICMSIIGTGTRVSTVTHATATSAATANRPRTLGEPQPHEFPSLSASSRATSQTESSTAGTTGRRPGVRTGDSGTNSSAAVAATAVAIIGSQNNQW